MIRESLEDIGRSSLAEIYTSIVFAMEAREGPNAQDRAGRLIVLIMTSAGPLVDSERQLHRTLVLGRETWNRSFSCDR